MAGKSKGKGKGVGKGKSNFIRQRLSQIVTESESDSESHARSGADVKGKKRGEPGHSMQDIAWTKVDTDDEGVFERGNGKWSGFPDPDPVHPAQHRRGGGDVSSDDDDTRFIYFGTAAQCVESLKITGDGGLCGDEEDEGEEVERDLIYGNKEFTVRSVVRRKQLQGQNEGAGEQAMNEGEAGSPNSSAAETSSSSPAKKSRKRGNGKVKKKAQTIDGGGGTRRLTPGELAVISHSLRIVENQSRMKLADKRRKKREKKNTETSRNDNDPQRLVSRSSSPEYVASAGPPPRKTRHITIELSSGSDIEDDDEIGYSKVRLFSRVRLSRADSPLRSRRSAGKPLNASREEVDSSPESYRTRVEEAKTLNTSRLYNCKLYLAKKQKNEEIGYRGYHRDRGIKWISYRTPKDLSLSDPGDFPLLVETN